MVKAVKAVIWEFEFTTEAGDKSTLAVHPRTGHWATRINRETGELGDNIYIYEATLTPAAGKKRKTFVTQATLDGFREDALK